MAASDVNVAIPLEPVEMPSTIRSSPPLLLTLMFPFDVEALSSMNAVDVATALMLV